MTVYDVAAKLPPIDVLRVRCQALAVLERVMDAGEPFYAYPAGGATARRRPRRRWP